MKFNLTVSRSGLFYRGVCSVRDEEGITIDQKTSSHDRLSHQQALEDAAALESYYRKFNHFA